ncbi:MAG: DUF6958 family protein [Nannocystaceae bacterium]|nr:hypothetical protein [bacterium]
MPRRADALNRHGLSKVARSHLPDDVRERVAAAWSEGRALILNANKPNYSEAFTIEAAQYAAVRACILDAVDSMANDDGEVLLKDVVAAVQAQLGADPLFPNGRMTNYTRYTKTDLEARGELVRVPRRSPQRIRRP